MPDAQEWKIREPRVLDVGGEAERVRKLLVAVVGGRVDVVTHSDSPAARVEVSGIEGEPLKVRWDGTKLSITHGKDSDNGIVDKVVRMVGTLDRNKVVLSVSVPEDAECSVNSVTAGGLVAGVRARTRVNTVSGGMALDDIEGTVDVNTVSGDVECRGIRGPLHVNSVSGSVTAQQSDLPEVSIHTVSGDIALDLVNPRASVTSNSVSGEVTVRAPHDGYDVTANTASGQIVVDGHELRKTSGPPRGRLTEGDGGLRMKATSVSGSIVLLRSDARQADQSNHGTEAV